MKHLDPIDILYCHTCSHPIQISRPYPRTNNAIFQNYLASCKCSIYPVICGILIYSSTCQTLALCQHIRNGNYLRALISQLELNKLSKICFSFIIAPYLWLIARLNKSPNERTRNIVHICILSLLQLTSGDSSLWRYFLKRETLSSYKLSLLTLPFITKKTSVYVDIGCSNGLLLREVSVKRSNLSIVGIDQTFIFLLLARIFIVKSDTILIRCSVEDIPIASEKGDIISINDAWQYIPKTKRTIQMLRNISSKSATIVLFHVYNPEKSKQVLNVQRPTSAKSAIEFFQSAGFTYFSLLSNKKLLSHLHGESTINLTSIPIGIVDMESDYSLIVSKKPIVKSLQQNNLIEKTNKHNASL